MVLDYLPEGIKRRCPYASCISGSSFERAGSAMAIPLGKSGVNHRLRKLSEMAQKLREQQGGASRYD